MTSSRTKQLGGQGLEAVPCRALAHAQHIVARWWWFLGDVEAAQAVLQRSDLPLIHLDHTSDGSAAGYEPAIEDFTEAHELNRAHAEFDVTGFESLLDTHDWFVCWLRSRCLGQTL